MDNNYYIYCTCGCGNSLLKYNNDGVARYYLLGHKQRDILKTEKVINKLKRKKSTALRAKLSYKAWLYGKKSLSMRRKLSKRMSLENHPQWKGGIVKIKGDHIIQLVLDKKHPMYRKYAQAHRLKVEKYLGRYLTREELVHHINEKKQQNNLSNLCLTSMKNHIQIHTRIRVLKKKLKVNKLSLSLYQKCAREFGKIITEIKVK